MRASKRPKNTVRRDPRRTMIDPNLQVLMLVQKNGQPLIQDEIGTHDGKFQYVWVDGRNENQWAQYQAKGYMPVKVGEACAQPKHDMCMADGSTLKKGQSVMRSGQVLTKRPIERAHEDLAYGRELVDDRLDAMGLLDEALARRAQHGDMRIERSTLRNVERD